MPSKRAQPVPASLCEKNGVARHGVDARCVIKRGGYILAVMMLLFLLQRNFHTTILEFAFLCIVRRHRLLGPPTHAGHPIGWQSFVD